MIYKPFKLPYSFDALEPWIDAQTMEIHYTKHYQAYLNNLNSVIEKYPALQKDKLDTLLGNLGKLSLEDKDRIFFKNNAGGYLNHNLYWQIMDPKKETDEDLRNEIIKEFGSTVEFKKQLTQLGISHFGSGWAHLVKKDGRLKIYSLPNQDSPILIGDEPIIALDVWEHAYYLKYQNRRTEYIENWWKIVKII